MTTETTLIDQPTGREQSRAGNGHVFVERSAKGKPLADRQELQEKTIMVATVTDNKAREIERNRGPHGRFADPFTNLGSSGRLPPVHFPVRRRSDRIVAEATSEVSRNLREPSVQPARGKTSFRLRGVAYAYDVHAKSLGL